MIAVYKILNTLNSKFYIGSTINIRRRFNTHKRHLNTNKHPNPHLQAAWNKYGEQVFDFQVVEECKEEELIKREQFYIDKYQVFKGNNGYNICIEAKTQRGIKRTPEQNENNRRARIGKKLYRIILS